MKNELDVLLEEHQRIRAMLDHFTRQLGRFEEGEQPDYDILNGSIAYSSEYLEQWHHPKEDAVLAALEARSPGIAASLGELTDQHDGLTDETRELARIFLDVSERGAIHLREELVRRGEAICRSYLDHLSWEEQHFFPVARRLLLDEDWQELARRFKDVRDPLATNPVDKRYTALFSAIADASDN